MHISHDLLYLSVNNGTQLKKKEHQKCSATPRLVAYHQFKGSLGLCFKRRTLELQAIVSLKVLVFRAAGVAW